MKTSITRISLLFTVLCMIFTFIACEEKTDPPTQGNVEAPKEIISIAQAKEMYDAYTDRRVPIIREFEGPNQDSTQFEPTRYGHYDYETIKNYLAYIEHEAELAGVEISGLRFYFSNYPDKQEFQDGKPVKYPKQNSFFIMPTMKKDGGDHGFITTGAANGARTAVLIKDRIAEMDNAIRKQQGFYKQYTNSTNFAPNFLMIRPYFQGDDTVGGDKSLVLNESNLIPPPPQNTDMDK